MFYRVSTDLDNKDGGVRSMDTEYEADAKIVDNFKRNKEMLKHDKEEKALILKSKQKLAILHKK